ncbi:MAG: adenylate/guanylate cyclase domain-containing protein [Deltaproteobacteria bacterium]|nr:adenylate/guanylate cyclase domain-containing protein [Deltaproteobacteria bacterium]
MLKRYLVTLAIGLLAGLLVVGLYLSGMPFLELMELKSRDAIFRLRPPLKMDQSKIMVVAIGERSLDQLGRWPWSRTLIADLVETIMRAGAGVLALDMGFFEPDNRLALSAVLELQKAAQKCRPMDLEEFIGRHHPDYRLALTIARHRERICLGYFFHTDRRQISHLEGKATKERIRAITKFAFPIVRYSSPAALEANLPTAVAPENNLPLLIKASRWGGYFNVLPDYDGVVRRIPMIMRCEEEIFPSLALLTLARLAGKPLPPLTVTTHGLAGIELAGVHIPVDEQGRLPINFRGGSDVVPVLEAADVINGRAPPDSLKGKAVLLVVSAAGVMDHWPTPIATLMPGGFIQAQAMDNILRGDYLVKTNFSSLWDLIACLFLALAAAVLLAWLHPVAGATSALGLAATYTAMVYVAFTRGLLLSLVHPLVALSLAGVAGLLYRYFVLEKDKQFIRRAFGQYLSPAIIEELTKNPEGLELGGEKKELTVLFADIRNFTNISEVIEPEVLASVLNTFMNRLTQEVLAQGGVLDKYIGDAIMAFFGAPVEQPDHPARACRAALGMVLQAEGLKFHWEKMGVPPLDLGVGINTGIMVVGNMGSDLRFDYTVIGDSVNLGSRLESQTKDYGVSIVVSQSTRLSCDEEFHFRVLDLIRVKGKNDPVLIHQLIGPADQPAPPWLDAAEEAFALYLDRDFIGASKFYDRVLALNPGDYAAELLGERCLGYLEQPPPSDWDGTLSKESK